MKYIKISRYEKKPSSKPVTDVLGNNVHPIENIFVGGYIQSFNKILEAIDGEFDDIEDMDIGTKIVMEVVEMTEQEYNKLPEFEGY